MNAQKLRELDDEMHALMGWQFDPTRKCWHRNGFWTAESDRYTTDDAAAMQLLDALLKRDWTITNLSHHDDAGYAIDATCGTLKAEAWDKTKELAICKLAQEIHAKMEGVREALNTLRQKFEKPA